MTDSPVRQLRLVVHVSDFDASLAFYRDTLGLEQEESYVDGDARVVILGAGRATLELINDAQRELIDQVEVGRRVAREIRVAFEVVDAAGATYAREQAGAEVIAQPTETPWRSLNARLEAADGLQLTLFQELDG
jgi:catechol 2,3-dioxygenase-like lactoylglutathione lyase family enzyme